jgi:uncharacterized UBP type Zn finger protein
MGDQGWILMNDEKCVKAVGVEKMSALAYVYVFTKI